MEVLASSSRPQSNMSKDNTLKDYISKAKIIIEDDKKLKKLIEDVLEKLKELSNDKKSTEKLNESLRLFIRMVNAYTSKEYTYVPWKTICLLVAGLIYFCLLYTSPSPRD